MKRRRALAVVDNDLAHDARVRRQAQSLSQHGWQVFVVSRGHERTTVVRLNGYTVIPVGAPALRHGSGLLSRVLRALWRKFLVQYVAWRLIRRLRPTVVHVHDVDVFPGSWIAAKLQGAPIIYDAHELHAAREEFGVLQFPIRIVEGFLVRRVAAVTAPTFLRAQWLAREYRIRKPVVVPNRPPYNQPVNDGLLRKHCAISPASVVFLYQGVVNEGRGLHRLIDVLASVEKAHLVILGSGRMVESLQAHAQRVGVMKSVSFHPAVPLEDLPCWTASADVGIQLLENTSLNHYTTDSNKLYEYLMAGLPVIASDFPEIRRIVEMADAGLLVEPSDSGAIHDALCKLVDDPELRERFAANARESGRRLSWEYVESTLLELFEGVAGGQQC